ncbi:MAG: polysaccharide biosynthesis tyrosine autokinase [Anaerolineaceae bacterium]|nr:polysaccharide biosynthesis tyrosine autokinase [Anaerolineaceae bacterium]
MDIRQLLNIFKRWVWLLVLGTLLAGVAGYFVSNSETPLYQASTRFVVLRAAQTGSYDYYSYLDSQQLITTYAQLLTTDSLLEEASATLGFPVFAGQAKAEQLGETQFVRLTVTNKDPEKAAIIANVLVNVLIGQNDKLQSIRYINAEQNLQTRIEETQAQIDTLQSEIDAVSSSTVQNQLATVQKNIDDIQGQINELETQITALRAVVVITEEQQSQLAEKQANLAQLKPVLELYQQIYTNLVVLGKPVESGGNTSGQLDQLQTTLNLYQQIYISSISSLEALRLAQAQNTPTVVQVEPATVPGSPISPKPVQTGLLYAAVGLVVTAGIAFLVEYLDDTIKTPDDVKNALGLTVIGLVAEFQSNQIKGSKEQQSGMFVANQPRSPVSEAFRALRTNLEFSSIDRPLKTILVTSSGEGEGKTTIASNLAVILAHGGKKVLLVDADLRRPKVHQQFDIPNRAGLSDLVRGRMDVTSVTQTLESIKRLHIIPSGSLPPDPAELLGSSKMTTIIEGLKKNYDIVVIDSPPMLVSDAQILSSRIDGIIFVVRPGKTHTGAAISPLDELKRIKAKVLGVVLNRIPRNRSYFYGGYRYYSPHYTNTDYLFKDTLSSPRSILPEITQKEGEKKTALPLDESAGEEKKIKSSNLPNGNVHKK